ncbi:MAG: 50S ribosomal protein L2 [Phycisphaeraceae bacterium]|nr:MAG: 50S ribosomal protein L2 [Phycisphaeraceae bacterium]
MPIRIYRPTSAGRRNASVNIHAEVTKNRPEKSLTAPLTKTGGRNHHGIITVRGRGGGHKRMYRKIDFRRADRIDIPGEVIAIEYDPNRTCHIALVQYEDGVKRYILAPKGIRARVTDESGKVVTPGTKILASNEAIEPSVGSSMKMKYIPTGLEVHCVELTPGKGGQMCRAAGMSARLTNREGRYATLVLPSGEIRRVSVECRAIIGEVGNSDHANRRLGKAGKSRHLGRRPKTRGVAMDHATHPLGGGEGRSKSGRAPVSKTGVPAKGGSTRNRKQHSEDLIIRRRRSRRYGLLK